MRCDVSTFGELHKAVNDYQARGTSEPMVLVIHAPARMVYRFIINMHGIVRQECDARGEAREDDL
jgi:hypothetical protein